MSISGLLIVMGKPIRSAYLGTVKHDWTPIVCYWANRKPFLSARGNIWNSKEVFYNKTTSCWGADVSIEIYELLLLFSIITSCSHLLPFVITHFISRCYCHSSLLVAPPLVTRFHLLYGSLLLVVTRCTTRLYFYKQPFDPEI